MLLRRVLVQIDQCEHLVQVNVEKRAELVNNILIILRIDRNVITRVISDPAAWKALSQTTNQIRYDLIPSISTSMCMQCLPEPELWMFLLTLMGAMYGFLTSNGGLCVM